MCLCVRLQDTLVKPSKDDPIYLDRAFRALRARAESSNGMQFTRAMVLKEKRKQRRKDCQARWARADREKKRLESLEKDAQLVAEHGFGPPPPPPTDCSRP